MSNQDPSNVSSGSHDQNPGVQDAITLGWKWSLAHTEALIPCELRRGDLGVCET